MVETILAIAKTIGVSGQMLLAICTVESNLHNVNNFTDPHHHRPKGSYGACQVSLDVAREINPELDILALQQPNVNIEVAGKYLKKLEIRYGNIFDAVSAYNCGSVRKDLNGQYSNKRYVDKVAAIYYNNTNE